MTSSSSPATDFAERDEAEFVDDQQILAGKLLLQALQTALIGGLDQLMHHGGGGG